MASIPTQTVTSSERPSVTWRWHLIVILGYLLLAILVTWPTVAHLATQLPGDGGDDPAIAWNLWWVKHALLTLQTTPLNTDFMFLPIGVNLAYYTLTTLNALTALPLTLNLGVVSASNLHLLFTFVVGGYGVFLLVRQETGKSGKPAFSFWAAALSGAFYAFASSQVFYVSLGQFNIASSHWLPYVVLFVLRSRRDLNSLRPMLMTALFLTLQAWAEMTYASFALIFIAIFVIYQIVISLVTSDTPPATSADTSSKTSALTLALRNLVLTGLLFAIGISPLLAHMLPEMQSEGDIWVQGTGFAEVFSADLLGFLLPPMHHPLFGDLVSQSQITAYDKGQHLFLGFTLLLLAAIGTWTAFKKWRAERLFWVVAAIFFAWLSLGPTIHVNGANTGIPGPFRILQALPFFKGNRYPSRYSVLLILCLSVLAGYGLMALLKWANRRSRAEQRPTTGVGIQPGSAILIAVLLAAFLFEHLSIPLPQSDMTVPPAYYMLAEDNSAPNQGPAGNSLLDIPIAWRNGFRIAGPIHPGFMFGQFYQTVHQRPLLQGNTSRNPEFKFQYFTRAPIINSILALETGHELPPGRIESDQALAADVLRFFDIRDIVVRPGPGSDPAVVPEKTLPYIEAVFPVEKSYQDSDISVYHVNLPPLPKSVRIAAEDPLVDLYLGEGWGGVTDLQAEQGTGPLWVQRSQALLFVPLQPESQNVRMRVLSPGEDQRLTVRVAGFQSEPIALSEGWGEYTTTLPAYAVREGLNKIVFEFDQQYPLNQVSDSTQPWPFVSLVVASAGQEVGDFAHIYLDGVDLSPNQRGYNIVAITPDGSIQSAAFDTHLDPDQSLALAAFVQEIPVGSVVAVAISDEASMQLKDEAVTALHSLGIEGDMRDKFRWSQAAIGIKGTQPGTAVELMDEIRPVSVSAGPVFTEPDVAVGIEFVEFKTQ